MDTQWYVGLSTRNYRSLILFTGQGWSARYVNKEVQNTHVYTFLEEGVDRMVAVLSILISFLTGPIVQSHYTGAIFRRNRLSLLLKFYKSLAQHWPIDQLKAGSGIHPIDQKEGRLGYGSHWPIDQLKAGSGSHPTDQMTDENRLGYSSHWPKRWQARVWIPLTNWPIEGRLGYSSHWPKRWQARVFIPLTFWVYRFQLTVE